MKVAVENSEYVEAHGLEDIIFREGDIGDELYIILSGSVGIRSGDGAPEEQFAELGPGEFFGEMAVIDSGPRSATAVALDPETRLMRIDAPRFVYLVSQQPGFALLMMETLSARQRGASLDEYATRERAAPTPEYRVEKIDEGAYQLLARGRSGNAYLFIGPARTVLVDTSLPSWTSALHKSLGEIGVDADDIDLIVLTHEHFDHVASVPSFGGRPKVAAGPLAANKIRLQDEFATMQRAFGEPFTPFDVHIELGPSSRIDTGAHSFSVYMTPGHSSGGVSLFDEKTGMVVVGDTVMKGGVIGGIFGSGSISDLVHSLDLLGDLRPTLMLSGHGPISHAPVEDIAATRQRCLELLGDSKILFQELRADETVKRVLTSFRDLNRQWLRR